MESPQKDRLSLGKTGEEAAVRYLKKRGYKIVGRGFRLLRGEIDILAYDRTTLVFAEVKTRTSLAFGFPEESVTPAKQAQIRKIAQGYLAKHRLENVPCRFDVLSVMIGNDRQVMIRHFENAF
jgi:putative endonuclease